MSEKLKPGPKPGSHVTPATEWKPGPQPIGVEHRFQPGHEPTPPCKLTPEVHERSVFLRASGENMHMIADDLGIRRKTFYDWIARAEADLENDVESKYTAWLRDFHRAELSVKRSALGDIVPDPKGHRGREYQLKVLFPEEFGDRTRTELTGANGGPVQVKNADAAELSQSLERLARSLGITAQPAASGAPAADPGDEPETEG